MTNDAQKKIRVLLVDHYRLLCEGLTALLTLHDMEVCGCLQSGEEAVSRVPVITPDVVLIDTAMSGMTAIEAARRIKKSNRSIKVILMSSGMGKELLEAGIQSGIDGHLPKEATKVMLIDAIRRVVKGEYFFTEAITSLIFEDFFKKNRSGSLPGRSTYTDLTKRESEVLAGLVSGKGNRQIADDLFISVKTVDTHRSHVLEKLGLKNNVELLKYAIRNNLVQLD